MVKLFIMERRSWIAFFLFLQLFVLFVAYLDLSIPLSAIIYVVFLSGMLFILFFIYRYLKETKYYKGLSDWDNHLDVTAIGQAKSPFEKIVQNSVVLQTEQLKKEAQQNQRSLEKEKDELLTWIHEVKTPLTAMHLMIGRIEDDKIRASLTYEWLRIHLLLDQQLHQKRIPFIENDVFIEKIQVKALLMNELKTLQAWCIQKGLGIEMKLEVEEVTSDLKWLAYIIRQLLTNAVKYSNHSEIVIKSYQQDGHSVLEIKDEGCGIDAKDLPRLFEKGFTTTNRQYESHATGMGLYLAKKAADKLSIKIGVKSKLGAGTSFWLVFPKKNEFLHITRM